MWIDNDWPEAAETLQTVRKQTSKLKSKHLRKCRETSVQHKVIKEHLDWFAFEKSNLSDNSSLFQTRPPPNFRQSHQLLGFSDLIMNKILAFLDVSDILSLSYTCKQGHYVTFPIWSTIPVAVNIPNVYDKLTHTSKANESRSVETRQVFVINEGHHGADHPQHNALVTGNSHHTSSLNRPTMADDIDVAMMFRTLRAPTCTHTVALNPPRLACSGVSSDGEDGFSTAHTHTRGGRSITTTYTPTVPILPFTQAYTRYYPCPRLTVTQRGRPSHVGGCNGGGVCVDHTTCAAVMAAVTQAALHAPALHVHAGVSVCVCEDINGSVAVSDPVPHPHYPPIEALTLMSDIPRHINAVLRERLCFESNIACLKEISVDDHHVDVLLLVCRLIVEHNSQLTHSESVIGALDVMSLSRCSSGELEQLASVLDEVQLRLQQHVLQRQQALLQRREQEDLLRSLQLCDDDGVATYVRDESTFLTSSADTHTAFIDMRELTCSECDIPDALIHALSHCRELRRLRVVHCQVRCHDQLSYINTYTYTYIHLIHLSNLYICSIVITIITPSPLRTPSPSTGRVWLSVCFSVYLS